MVRTIMNKFNTAPVYPFDGNAFNVMGAASKAMRKAGASKDDVDAYTKDAMSGDYDHLLRVTMEHVDLCAGPEPMSDEESDEQMCDYCGDTMLFCECEECEECGDFVTNGECYSADLHNV